MGFNSVFKVLYLHKSALFQCNGIWMLGLSRGYRHQANAAHCSVIRTVPILRFTRNHFKGRRDSGAVISERRNEHSLSSQVITNSRVTRPTSPRHCLHLPLERLAVTNNIAASSSDYKNIMGITTLTRICLSLRSINFVPTSMRTHMESVCCRKTERLRSCLRKNIHASLNDGDTF